MTAPVFLADYGGRDAYIPGPIELDPTSFPGIGTPVIVGAAGAAANATTVPVAALDGAIPSGTTLKLGAKKFALLTAPATKGATSLTVEALPTALVSGDTAIYSGLSKKLLAAGTYVGRTQAEKDAGTPFGPADAADAERYLLAFSVDFSRSNTATAIRHLVVIKENFLPEWTILSANAPLLVALRADYQTQKGAA